MTTKQGRSWRTSSYTANGSDCVEVAVESHGVGVRDSKHRDGGSLELAPVSWAGLIRAARNSV